jgi:hypothetical protein
MQRPIRIKSKSGLNPSSICNLSRARFLMPKQMTSTSSRSSTQSGPTNFTGSLHSNIFPIDLLTDLIKMIPDSRFTLTNRRARARGRTISRAVGVGGRPRRRTVAGIVHVDTEQLRSVFADVVVILNG